MHPAARHPSCCGRGRGPSGLRHRTPDREADNRPWQNAYVERYHRTVRHERLDQQIKNIEKARDQARQGLWTCDTDRPNMGVAGITPAMKLKKTAQVLRTYPIENGEITGGSAMSIACKFFPLPNVQVYRAKAARMLSMGSPDAFGQAPPISRRSGRCRRDPEGPQGHNVAARTRAHHLRLPGRRPDDRQHPRRACNPHRVNRRGGGQDRPALVQGKPFGRHAGRDRGNRP